MRQLAGAYGIQSVYRGFDPQPTTGNVETVLHILSALGAPVSRLRDAQGALREYRQGRWNRVLEPVTVAWGGGFPAVRLRLPERLSASRLSVQMRYEDGDVHSFTADLGEAPTLRRADVEGQPYLVKLLPVSLPLSAQRLPLGYHRLRIEAPGHAGETLLISASEVAYRPRQKRRGWGVFIPLYSLYSKDGLAAGDLGDLRRLVDWVAGLGGATVASLPLLATYLGEPLDPSPYMPVSKLFWSEFYIDLNGLPGTAGYRQALRRMESPEFRAGASSLRAAPLVDYKAQMALKRPVLEAISESIGEDLRRSAAFLAYASEHPEAESFARFRAFKDTAGVTWRRWPERQRHGDIREGDYSPHAYNYHATTQYLAHEQVRKAADFARRRKVGLYLDLPLGVHPEGYDTWRFRDLFVDGLTVGAPPDLLFVRGQDWAFPPLHPQRLRESYYGYFIDTLRHHLRRASTLRVDHVMGFHRLFFIPEGAQPGDGMYVRYHPNEIYAIVSLESHRHRAMIVGEDLGIVPEVVRGMMERHGLQRMYVLHYEVAAAGEPILKEPAADMVASINTHDMPPFASFWSGKDIPERRSLGILDDYKAAQQSLYRAMARNRLTAFLRKSGWLEGDSDAMAVLRACLSYLAASRARLVIVNLEDLWLETNVQNYPSTNKEYPNWRQRARFDRDTFCQMTQVTSVLQTLNRLRGGIRHE